MIIQQTTTLIFEYPQDYLQEQEWCKTKEDRWIHKGTDTLGAVYENTISYSIGQPQTEPTSSKMEQVEDETRLTAKCLNCANGGSYKCSKCDGEMYFSKMYFKEEPKDEPQTERRE